MNPVTSTHAPSSPPASLLVATAGWLAAVIVAAQSGALAALGRIFMPGYALLVAIGIAMPVAAYFTGPTARRAVDAIGLHRLTLLHIWRIPAALMFFYYGMRGELPGLFWLLAGVGDLLAGAYAATLVWRPHTAANYRAVHLFGFTDFIVAVGTGLTFTLLRDPRMALLTTLPMALIPLFGVGLSGASHIIALTRLARPNPRDPRIVITTATPAPRGPAMSSAVVSECRTYEGRRITLRSSTPFDVVVARLEASFPPVDTGYADALVAATDAAGLRAYFERVAPGVSFNVFHRLDQGGAMSLLGTPLKSRYYLVGNALIAQGMFALERAAGLCAPVRLVVTEAAGSFTQIDYDEPTSIFSQFPALESSPIPRMLDVKFREALTAFLA